jgi:hypothetical protein
MINVIEEDNGVRMLDVETYLNTFQKVKISKDLTLRVGKITVEQMAKTKALGQELKAKQKEVEEKGETLDESILYDNIVDQMMVVLEGNNPELERSQLAGLPPAAINQVFKFLLKEGMGLGEGLGNSTAEVAVNATTTA